MTRNKIIIAGVVGVAVAAGIACGVLLQNQQKRGEVEKPPAPNIAVDAPPRIITVPDIPKDARFVYVGPTKTVPQRVPAYQFTESLSAKDLNALAGNISTRLSFTAKPTAIVEGDYFAYMRNETNKSFSLSKTKNIVSITYQRALVEDSSLVVANSAQSASSFFSSLLSLPGGETLFSLPSDKTVFSGILILEKPTPQLTNYMFGITIGGAPLLTRENTKRWASLIVDDRGAVRVLNYLIPPAISQSEDVQIIPVDEAIANINYGRGDLLWITQTSGEEYGVTASFTSGNLTDYSLVYVFQGSSLVPAYLFEGNGTAKTGDQQIFEALVLAFPSATQAQ
jgi:hypothetical protein